MSNKFFAKKVKSIPFYKKLLFSYLLLLLVLVLSILAVTNHLINTISQYTNQEAAHETMQYRTQLEDRLLAIEELSKELSVDDKVSALLYSSGEFDARTRYDFHQITGKLRSYQFLNDYIATIFIYLPAQQYIVTDSSVFTVQQWNSTYLNSPDFESSLNAYHNGEWMILNGDGQYAGYTAMLSGLPAGTQEDKRGTLCVIVDPNCATGAEQAKSDQPTSHLFTVDRLGEIIFSTDNVNPLLKENGMEPAQIELGIHALGEYVLYAVKSPYYPFTHVLMTPAKQFNQILTTNRMITGICVAALFFIGIALSFVLAHYNYRPIQRLAKIIGVPQKASDSPLVYIESSINELMDIRDNAQENLRQNNQLHMEGLLSKLMHSEILTETLVNEYMKKFDLHLCGEYVQMAVLHSDGGVDLRQIKQRLRERIQATMQPNEELQLLAGPNNLKLFFFYKVPPSTPQKMLEKLSPVLSEALSQFVFAVSDLHYGFTQLGQAYEETQKVLDYMHFLGIYGFFSYSEWKQTSFSNDRSMIFETWFKKFSNFLIDQNLSAARSIQTQIFDELKSSHYSIQFVKCKVFSFVDQTINVIAELDAAYNNDLWEDFNLSDRLMRCSTIDQLEAEYYEIFQQLSEILVRPSSRAGILDKIREITDANYKNPAFSVSFVSDALGVSTPYISKFFKKETGRNMLDYVQQMRITEAKRLMREEPTITITAVAERSGFYNDVSFIRVFKKYEGITPGKYRKQIAGDN